ncbi:MAG TPA: hypothetical protein PKX48_04230 [Planctomycetota bacterium]|jgi:hypothetical protein|nr:hypothetical protein [Planctomycetota bacterium]OQC21436.1 MAG: hypothetical protein BWX69_00922 [Planctomycetes bacterium ADurb.Bin069]HNR97805.1 hypothetical protein [Planctomycetota bacterium]HNU24728.1 hypothetical protein [Planctomycetota bacterium]HOE29930.1 hypothetical protein [Planctomycetota bacterium]
MHGRTRFRHALPALLMAGALASAADGVLRGASVQPAGDPAEDWLVARPVEPAEIRREGRDLILTNGLIRRVFRLAPNAATVALDNLMTGAALLRAVKPEARVTLNGAACDVGGLIGQPDQAYLPPEWIDAMGGDPDAFAFESFQTGPTEAHMQWKRVRWCQDLPWPPPGKRLTLRFVSGADLTARILGTEAPAGPLLAGEDFSNPDPAWRFRVSPAVAGGGFGRGQAAGVIAAAENTCVFAERELPAGVRAVECLVDPVGDGSASWGPGVCLLWENGEFLKFFLRPGQKCFGVTDRRGELMPPGLAEGAAYRLRIRLRGATAYLEAAVEGEAWRRIARREAPLAGKDPARVRIGKTSRSGGADDFDTPGPSARCRVGAFRAFGEPAAGAPDAGAVTIAVSYEIYDGLPLMAKWLEIRNGTNAPLTLDGFTAEIIAAVEAESTVETPSRKHGVPNLQAFSDYMFGSDTLAGASSATIRWVADPDYETQVNYRREATCLLESRPPMGPGATLAPGDVFETYRTYILIHDSDDRERQGLAVRRAFRAIAPWVTENPIMMHVRRADAASVRLAVDQCAEVGFEMVILTFGSGFDIENDRPEYLAQVKELVDYARAKGVALGGYSLLASRSIGPDHDVVNPATGTTGGFARFGDSPCLGSVWGRDYFRKLREFFEKTGADVLEHDGSYPGDVCASTRHPGHRGLADSQHAQWTAIRDFYRWCRARGVYLNVPDYYYLAGSTKSAMGYRETNWSLPRALQIIHARQNIFDGTWEKTPSMGWMFVPLTEYHGGGAAATIEPLAEHLDTYEAHLANNFGAGVQACYRGPRLYDTEETKRVVKKWVDFYKAHRAILDSDILHLRRADGRDIDCFLHVNPHLEEKALLMVYNPLQAEAIRTIRVPLYYAGLRQRTSIAERGGEAREFPLDRAYAVDLPVALAPRAATWYVFK